MKMSQVFCISALVVISPHMGHWTAIALGLLYVTLGFINAAQGN